MAHLTESKFKKPMLYVGPYDQQINYLYKEAKKLAKLTGKSRTFCQIGERWNSWK